jgi:hypothetical protein
MSLQALNLLKPRLNGNRNVKILSKRVKKNLKATLNNKK